MKTKKKRTSAKIEECLSPRSSEDQKKQNNKGLHQKLETFCPRNQVKSGQKVQRSSSAQMQTIVKLLGGYIPPADFGATAYQDIHLWTAA